MKKLAKLLVLSISMLTLAWGPGAWAEATAGEEIRIYFELLRFESGRGLVALRVADVPETGLAGFQLTLVWNPLQLEILDPNAALVPYGVAAFAPLGDSPLCRLPHGSSSCSDPAWLLTATGRWTVGKVDHDPQRGRLTLAYGSGGKPAPATGSGTLALLEVRAATPELLRIEVADALLLDASAPPRRYPWRARALGPGEEVER